MRKIVSVVVVCCLLFVTGCSGGQDRTAVFGDDDTFLPWVLVTDGESVWKSVDSSAGFDGVAEVVKFDAATSGVKWRNEYGIGSDSDLVIYDSMILATFTEPPSPDAVSSNEEVFVQIDAVTGEVIDQWILPSITNNPVVVGDTVWLLGQDPEDIYVRNARTLDLIETIEFSSMSTPEGRYVSGLKRMTLLGETMWITDGRVLAGVDTTTHEVVDFVDPNDFGLNILEVHDGLLWVAKRGKPDEGTFSYDPEAGEVSSSELYESPIGNVYHAGYTYDMIDSSTMAQINTESGEQVATYTDLDPFSVVVTDGFLWAKDDSPRDQAGRQVFRYETKP